MDIYPQSQNGSVCQFPFGKSLRYRTICNTAEDGSRITLEDPNASEIRWSLSYSGLTDSERESFQTFFEAMRGRLKNFTFLDPSSNILTWSEDFSRTAWQRSSQLQITAGTSDPLGTFRAVTLSNMGSGDLTLAQSAAVPGFYRCCLSCYVRSSTASRVSLARDSSTNVFPVSAEWRRVSLSTTSSGTEASTFGIVIPAGAQVTVFGIQVEAQPKPSTYVPTLDRGGTYSMTRFESDSLTFRSDAPNSHACEIRLYSKLPL